MLYRICTEHKNYPATIGLVARLFDGFTVLKAEGFWMGQSEHSLVIEIVTENEQAIKDLAWDIKKHNKQEAVLIQKIECEEIMV